MTTVAAPKTTALGRARVLADETPESRNRYVDFLRAASIMVVVFGHWLMAGPEVLADGSLRVGHLIAEVQWVQAATWIFQVMPIFFFVGGYANATAWRSARQKGTTYDRWIRDRLRRLVLPVVPLVVVWTVAAVATLQAGIDPDLVRVGSQAALVPVWFLATYVLIVVTTPITLGWWERYGPASFVALAGAAAVVDVLSLGVGIGLVAWVNYLFVWNAVHMLGYAWLDGLGGTMRRRIATAVGGFTALALLVGFGPYPLAMVGLDAAAVTNSNPPKVTLIALGVFQFGLAMAMEGPARRMLQSRDRWAKVILVNASIMTLYLWHLTAMVAVIGISYAFGGVGLGLTLATTEWWITRPLWFAILVAVTLPFLMIFGRFERPKPDESPVAAWRSVLAAAAFCAGLGILARYGIADADGPNWLALGLLASGLGIGHLVRRT